VGARYAHQQRLARELGGTEALPPDQLARAVRRHSCSLSYGGPSGVTATLSGGADVVIDCVGSPESIAHALAMVRPRGTVSLVGMPGKVTLDLAPLWHREVRLAGAYAYGTESVAAAAAAAAGGGATGAAGTTRRKQGAAQPEEVPTFQLAFEVVAAQSTDPAKYLPLLAKINYPGITADIAFDANGDLTKGLLTIFEVKNGKWEVISK